MSTWIDGYTEARINGKWQCIDFFQYDIEGKLHHVPCITGQSFVCSTLEWNCEMENTIGVPEDLSELVRRECSSSDGVLYGTGELRWYQWYIVEGRWFAAVNLEVPEYCGFFSREDICRYLSNPDENDLNPEKMLSIEEYQALEPEIKKAYQYYEYTDPTGSRRIMRDFKQAVMDRIRAFNNSLTWENMKLEITPSDVRVLILQR